MLSNNRLKAHKLTHWQAFVAAKRKSFPLPPCKSILFSSLEHRGSKGSFSKCFESYCNIFHEADSILTVLIATERWCIYNTWALSGPQSTKSEQIHSIPENMAIHSWRAGQARVLLTRLQESRINLHFAIRCQQHPHTKCSINHSLFTSDDLGSNFS